MCTDPFSSYPKIPLLNKEIIDDNADESFTVSKKRVYQLFNLLGLFLAAELASEAIAGERMTRSAALEAVAELETDSLIQNDSKIHAPSLPAGKMVPPSLDMKTPLCQGAIPSSSKPPKRIIPITSMIFIGTMEG